MSPLLYWILFGFLVSLLVIFLSCIVFNIILDKCLSNPEESSGKMHQPDAKENERHRLNRYRFDRHDVEDLTRIEGDFKTVLPKVILTNEVTSTSVERLLKKNEHHKAPDVVSSSLYDIHEEEASNRDVTAVNVLSTVDEEIDGRPFREKKNISQSVDDLEFCNPTGIDVLKEIHRIEEQARIVEQRELNYFVGGTTDVKYYEINEKFLKLMISLCDVKCETAELRKKKSEILEYIEGCQRKLKDKANNRL